MSLTVFDFNDKGIRFEKRGERVWVSLTDMAKASGKLVADWNRLASTTEFLQEIELITGNVVIESKVGGVGIPERERGTWAIEEVAEEFGRWCLLPKKDKDRVGVLYVYQDANNNAYKIGYTADLKKRQKQHKTSNPFLELVKIYPGVTIDFESLVHLSLANYRIPNTTEWYRKNKNILPIINLQYSDYESCEQSKHQSPNTAATRGFNHE